MDVNSYMCVDVFVREYHDFLISFDAGSHRQCICSYWKTLENKSANLQLRSGLEGILSKYFSIQKEGFQVQTALSMLTVKVICQIPFVNFDMSNLRAIVTHT